jgi:hypothetical protein
MEPFQKPEPDQAVEDEEDRHDQIEKPRHDEDQKARDHGYDRRDMGNGEGHKAAPLRMEIESRSGTLSPRLPCSTTGDAFGLNGFRLVLKIDRKQRAAQEFFLGNDASSDELDGIAGPAVRRNA